METRGANATDAHYKGASNELKAAAYFLSQGHQVFFPMMQQGVVDFVIDSPDGLKRVQVKTASLNTGFSTYDYIQCRLARGSNDPRYSSDAFDLLVVIYEDRMWVIPWSEISSTNICLSSTNPQYAPRGRDYSEYEV